MIRKLYMYTHTTLSSCDSLDSCWYIYTAIVVIIGQLDTRTRAWLYTAISPKIRAAGPYLVTIPSTAWTHPPTHSKQCYSDLGPSRGRQWHKLTCHWKTCNCMLATPFVIPACFASIWMDRCPVSAGTSHWLTSEVIELATSARSNENLQVGLPFWCIHRHTYMHVPSGNHSSWTGCDIDALQLLYG